METVNISYNISLHSYNQQRKHNVHAGGEKTPKQSSKIILRKIRGAAAPPGSWAPGLTGSWVGDNKVVGLYITFAPLKFKSYKEVQLFLISL